MAEAKTVTKDPAKAAETAAATSTAITPANGNAALAASTAAEGDIVSAPEPENWMKVGGDRMVYKPETCHDFAIQGLLLGRQELPGGVGGLPWAAYVVRLTAPTKATDRTQDDKLVTIPAGDEIYLPETARLAQTLQAAAENPDFIFEIWIKPTSKQKLGQGREMWLYTTRVSRTGRKRTESDRFFMGGRSKADSSSQKPHDSMEFPVQ